MFTVYSDMFRFAWASSGYE